MQAFFMTTLMWYQLSVFSMYFWYLFVCAENRRPSLKPSCIRPPLQLLLPLVWDPSTTLCLQTPHLLQASSFTPLMLSPPRLKPRPYLWPPPLHHLTRLCRQPLALSWHICSLALWWTLGLWTWLHTRAHRKPSRLVKCSLMLGYLTLLLHRDFVIQLL